MTTPVVLRRVSSGVSGLDVLLDGGIPEGTVTLVYGPPKTGKTLFVHQFLASSIRRGEYCHFVATDYDVQGLSTSMSTLSWGVQKALLESNIHLVDMTAAPQMEDWETGELGIKGWLSGSIRAISGAAMMGPKSISVSVPTQLIDGLDHSIHTLSQGSRRFCAIWDSLTPLFIYSPPIFVAKMLREYVLRIKRSGVVAAFVTYDEGSIDDRSETLLKACVDNVIHLQDSGKLTVEGMVGTPKVQAAYSITSSGIAVSLA